MLAGKEFFGRSKQGTSNFSSLIETREEYSKEK